MPRRDSIELSDQRHRVKVNRSRPSTLLTLRLLDEIRSSIQSFKPSHSLGKLVEDAYSSNNPTVVPQTEIDIVISGGGLKGYFMAGCTSVLCDELSKHNISIARIAGASAGAWAGMFMLCGYKTHDWIETYHACKERPTLTIHETYDEILDWVLEGLPENAYQICSGKLFISITFFKGWSVENQTISEFHSNRDLIDCCLASSTIPYLTEPKGFRTLRGHTVCDGGFTNNCPIFVDGSRRQLVFRLFEVEYPWRLLVNPQDTCIDVLVLRGAILMQRFLQGEPTDSIAWLEKREKKSSLKIKPNYYLRMSMVPFALAGD